MCTFISVISAPPSQKLERLALRYINSMQNGITNLDVGQKLLNTTENIQNCSTALLACHKKRRGWITYPSCASLKKMCRSVHKCPAETSAVGTLPSRPKRQQLEFQRFFAIPKTYFLTFLGPSTHPTAVCAKMGCTFPASL